MNAAGIEWKARLLRHSGSWLPVSAVLVAMFCGLGLVATVGVPMGDAIAAFADGAWGSAYAVGASLNRAMALGLVGLGFILANRANLTNVGGEGQVAMGGVVATAACLYGGAATLPGPLA